MNNSLNIIQAIFTRVIKYGPRNNIPKVSLPQPPQTRKREQGLIVYKISFLSMSSLLATVVVQWQCIPLVQVASTVGLTPLR